MRVDGSFPEWLPKPTYLHSVPGEPKEPGNPTQKMTKARDFFRGFGLPIAPNGLVDATALHPEHIDRLRKWREVVNGNMGVEMPTEDEFYRKTLLAVSLWPQKDGDVINYLIGKGAGVEVALRGDVKGRAKRPVVFPYRQHSDFELYDVKYNAGPYGENLDQSKVYSEEFKAVFGGQEYFPPTKTKGLSNLPPDLLDRMYEMVNLGSITVLVPQLELLFLDKLVATESTPRLVDGKVMTDAELLARQYTLDPTRINQYLEDYVIKPRVSGRFQYEAKKAKPAIERAAGFADLPYNYYEWLSSSARKLLADINAGKVTERQFRELTGQIAAFFAGELPQKPADLDTDEGYLVDRWINDAEVKRIGAAITDQVIKPLDEIYSLRNKVHEVLSKAY